ncbi:MAG: hypothetical protein QGI21_03615 [Candidatus Poseidoniaceae archaeon]|jgi:hypothetical protein|nr:hypothetical protein [Candidatus Poseidoniaceae archaeon]
MKWFEERNDHFWIALLFVAISLNFFAMYNSDLGLDVHVKSAYIEADDGYALDWGDIRQSNPDASNPEEATVVDFSPYIWYPLIGLLILITLRFAFPIMKNNPAIIALILLHPTIIFSSGKSYDELTILSLFGLGSLLLNYSYSRSNQSKPSILINIIAYSVMVLALLLKVSIESMPLLFVIGLIIATTVTLTIPKIKLDPRHILIGSFVLGMAVVFALGFAGYGTSKIIVDEPLRFLYALPFAILDIVIIYGIFGMILWPFVKSTWEKLGELEDSFASEFAFIIGGMSGLITAYVAVLWAYESILWNSEWPLHMLTMGNNGRYITIISIPIWLLIKRVHGEIDWANKKLFVGILLILPFSLLAGIHGQTMWTDDAANSMDLETGEHFVFVSDATLGMHWLYTFHAPLEADENNITGHWRSDGVDWISELDGDLSHVNWIVLAPEINEIPDGWVLEDSGTADYLNGGGTWKVMTRS